ncbi:uncharacterized zinc finger CCHC domain-containing protein At4g19190 [Typha latifolia]|uniref:uncharacterized zinc finger CCHC domain-containing protein At4g19190 n=1 Tax=Typha latifolia TaxID=4733 RepID=UPI003C2F032B
MEEEVTGGEAKLGKKSVSGEVDYKTTSGTAWSHSYLNQKPWHPLSYPNQRRKWIAEQTHANRERRQEEVAREFAQEQEFFRQTALFSKKEKEKVELMKAVSFMYVRPPGYNAESAKAAEVEDEKRRSDESNATQDPASTSASTIPEKSRSDVGKKARSKDVFGRTLPTEQEFEVLKNAPRLETGVPVRSKPFGVEIRNVRCVRCGTYGHQSGDRECPLKDAIMPNDESRLKRDDPLTAIMAQADSTEPLKWELKQKPGISPPRGGFTPDDPNQQIVADDIFDEYGGFLSGGDIPVLLSNFSEGKPKKHSKRKSRHKHQSPEGHIESVGRHSSHQSMSSSDLEAKGNRRSKGKHRRHQASESSSFSDAEANGKGRRRSKSMHKKQHMSESPSFSDSEVDERSRSYSKRKHKQGRSHPKRNQKDKEHDSSASDSFDSDHHRHQSRHRSQPKRKQKDKEHNSNASDGFDSDYHHYHHRRQHLGQPRRKQMDKEHDSTASDGFDSGHRHRREHRSMHQHRHRHKHHLLD